MIENKKWIMSIIEYKGGATIMWGELGVPLLSPPNQNKVYTDKSVEKCLKDDYLFSKKFLDKYFIFIDHWLSEEEIIQNKKYYKTYRHIKGDFGYCHNINTIRKCLEVCKEENNLKKLGWHQMAILYAQNILEKAKELQFGVQCLEYQLKSICILIPNYLQINDYYRSIKYCRKGFNLNISLKWQLQYVYNKSEGKRIMMMHQQNESNLMQMLKEIKLCLFETFSLEYVMEKNQIYYKHHSFSFHCKGYSILKYKNGQTLKAKLRKNRIQRCGHCEKLKMKSKKNEKVKRHKCSNCQRVYYCNKSCQKRHWSVHKLVCFI